MTKKKVTTAEKDAEELDAFAHYFAEALRIARTSDLFTARFYNSLADAWNDYFGDGLNDENFWHSEDYIRLALTTAARQRKESAK